jgi:hypothetical protein
MFNLLNRRPSGNVFGNQGGGAPVAGIAPNVGSGEQYNMEQYKQGAPFPISSEDMAAAGTPYRQPGGAPVGAGGTGGGKGSRSIKKRHDTSPGALTSGPFGNPTSGAINLGGAPYSLDYQRNIEEEQALLSLFQNIGASLF